MDLNNISNATKFYLKFLSAIFVTEDLNMLLTTAEQLGIDYSSIELLKMLKDLVVPYTLNNSLPDNVNQNIFSFVSICRDCGLEEDKKERYGICNDIIGLINSSLTKPPYPLYQAMINSYYPSFMKRFKNHISFLVEPGNIKTLMSHITEIEYLVLLFHSTTIENNDFLYLYSEDFVLSFPYLFAINHLLREEPNLLDDELFCSRLNFVLRNNEQLLKVHRGKMVEDCMFDLIPEDEETLGNKAFWKLNKQVKKKVLKVQKDS